MERTFKPCLLFSQSGELGMHESCSSSRVRKQEFTNAIHEIVNSWLRDHEFNGMQCCSKTGRHGIDIFWKDKNDGEKSMDYEVEVQDLETD